VRLSAMAVDAVALPCHPLCAYLLQGESFK
jgi:hypothetical protein